MQALQIVVAGALLPVVVRAPPARLQGTCRHLQPSRKADSGVGPYRGGAQSLLHLRRRHPRRSTVTILNPPNAGLLLFTRPCCAELLGRAKCCSANAVEGGRAVVQSSNVIDGGYFVPTRQSVTCTFCTMQGRYSRTEPPPSFKCMPTTALSAWTHAAKKETQRVEHDSCDLESGGLVEHAQSPVVKGIEG